MIATKELNEILKSEIKSLENAREGCTDSGIIKSIDVWVEELKRKLKAAA